MSKILYVVFLVIILIFNQSHIKNQEIKRICDTIPITDSLYSSYPIIFDVLENNNFSVDSIKFKEVGYFASMLNDIGEADISDCLALYVTYSPTKESNLDSMEKYSDHEKYPGFMWLMYNPIIVIELYKFQDSTKVLQLYESVLETDYLLTKKDILFRGFIFDNIFYCINSVQMGISSEMQILIDSLKKYPSKYKFEN